MPSVDGIVSGIDTSGLIQAIVTARTVAITSMKQNKSDFEKQREGVAGVKNRMQTLVDAIDKINDPTKLSKYAVTSSASGFTMEAMDGTAVTAGSYAIKVNSLASSQTNASNGFDDDPAAFVLGQGSVSVTVGGTTTPITIDGTNNSWEGLATEINKVSGVSAYVVDTGAATNRYQLVAQGDETGSANAFSIDASGLAGGTVPTFSTTATAADASATIGGVTVSSSSNTLEDVVPGLRITLNQQTSTAEQATVSLDTDATREAFKEVIDAFNAVRDYYATQTVYDTAKDIRGSLVGEASTRRAVEGLARGVTQDYAVAGSTFKSLAMFGIKTERDGKLTLDDAAFDEAFSADPTAAVAYLTDASGPLASIKAQVEDLYIDSENGSLVTRGEGLDSTIEDLDDQIVTAQDRLDSETARLRQQFNAMELALSQLQSSQATISAFFASSTTSTSSQ
ncbi:MAG: flagellar filament capping protein FliD [Myxococcales bacterium]|nr:flagellar filament capping protein FliD [Myxococcales bacterium]